MENVTGNQLERHKYNLAEIVLFRPSSEIDVRRSHQYSLTQILLNWVFIVGTTGHNFQSAKPADVAILNGFARVEKNPEEASVSGIHG